MALIKCSECGKQVSDRAKECNACGYPIHEFVDEVAGQVRIKVPSTLQTRKIAVSDENGNELVRIKSGEYYVLECSSPKKIFVKTAGIQSISPLIKASETVVSPGENYEVKFNVLTDNASLVKVDYLIQ